MTDVLINVGVVIRATIWKARVQKEVWFYFGGFLTKFLRENEVEEDMTNYKPSRNLRGFDVTRVKEPSFVRRPALSIAEKNARDDSLFLHLYGKTKLTMMCGVDT